VNHATTAGTWAEVIISHQHSHPAAHFDNPRAARAFADYLTTQGIINRVTDTAQGSVVELLDHAELPRFKRELNAFLDNPQDDRYLAASWEAGDSASEQESRSLESVYAGQRLRLRRGGPFTLTVIVACLAVFLEFNLGDPLGWWPQFRFFPSWGHLLGSGDWWRWFTSSLSHYQLMHVGFNLLWWWDLAGNVERRQGSLRLLTLFVLLNIVSNLSQFVVSGPNFLGLSGVVYGLLGYLWAYVRMCPAYPEPLNPLVFRSMIIWLFICLSGVVDLLMQGGIANAAHVGGLLAGMALGYWWGLLDRKTW
jgi:GlpG protein